MDDPGAGFGSGVACGDLSGDGVSDFALGGHFSSASGEESGAVLIWDGPKGELGTESDRSILGVEPFGWFGIRLAIYPQDGPDALAVGASRTESDGTVYLLDGDVDGEQDATRVEIARVEGSFADGSGTTLVVEDLDGDGTSDLVLGSWRAAAADGGDSGGQVAVYFGPLSGSVAGDNADLIARGETAGHYAGNAIAAGDLDGDGTLELLVGAPEAGTSGSVYVVDATSSGAVSLAEATAVLAAEEGLALGEVVAVVGDVDGDGLADVALGLPNLQGDVDEEGGALVFLTPLAGAVSTADAALHVIGEVVGDGAGSALLWYQDQDDPTESALLVGAFRDAESATDAGAVYQQRLSLD